MLLHQLTHLAHDLQIEDDGVHFKTILKAGGVMDVVEQYPWTGDLVTHKRRDKRAGHHEGRVQMSDDGPQLVLEWGEPHAGKGTDTFVFVANGKSQVNHGQSTVTMTMKVN